MRSRVAGSDTACVWRQAPLMAARGVAAFLLGLLFIYNCTLDGAPVQAQAVTPASVSYNPGIDLAPLQPTAAEAYRPSGNSDADSVISRVVGRSGGISAGKAVRVPADLPIGARPLTNGSRAPPRIS